ncbi:MAG: TIR domain-containing protein [Acidimicrobiales bacterium]
MAQSVFFSFDYGRDNWRVQQVLNMGAVEGGAAFTPQDWEEVREDTDEAIEEWIRVQMLYTRAVIVLVGNDTADSKWVKYEITKAWNEKRPLVGIRIHGLKNAEQKTDAAGVDPFSLVGLKGGGTVADYVTLHNPAGSTSNAVYDNIKNNMEGWVGNAYKRS